MCRRYWDGSADMPQKGRSGLDHVTPPSAAADYSHRIRVYANDLHVPVNDMNFGRDRSWFQTASRKQRQSGADEGV